MSRNLSSSIALLLVLSAFGSGAENALLEKNTVLVPSSNTQQIIPEFQPLHYCVDPDWLPHERITSDGQHQGIFADFITLIGKRAGLELSLFVTQSWSETITAAKQGDCDLISGINITPERQGYFYFSEPYLVAPMVIVTRDGGQTIEGLQDMVGMTLASVSDYRIAEIIQQQYPDIELVYYPNIGDALLAVSSGKTDAVVGSILGMSYNVVQLSLVNLRLAAHTEFTGEYRVALSRNNPELLGVFNRAISSISAQDKKNIIEHWVVLLEEKRIDYDLIIKIVLFCTFVIAIVFYRHSIVHKNNLALARVNTELQEAWQDAEQANEAKSQFLASISHELRTPMTGLIASLDLLGISNLDNKQLQLIESMQMAAQSQLTLLNHLLDSRRVQRGEMKLDQVEFHLKETLQQVLAFISPKGQQKGLSMTGRLAIPETLVVNGDPQAIRQVVLNLLNNAVKFTQQGVIELAAVVLVDCAERVQVGIEVKDSGTGIAESDHAKVFEPFFQVNSKDSSRFYGNEPGTGLGLSICASLLDLMGSQLNLSSNSDSTKGPTGSTFSFALTLEKVMAISSGSQKPVLNVLLLDAELLHQELVQFHLAKHQHDCTLVSEVSQVMDVLHNSLHEIDLVLADMAFFPAVQEALNGVFDNKTLGLSRPHLILMSAGTPAFQANEMPLTPIIKKPFSWQKLQATGLVNAKSEQ